MNDRLSRDEWWPYVDRQWNAILFCIARTPVELCEKVSVFGTELSTEGVELGVYLEKLREDRDEELVEWLRMIHCIADKPDCFLWPEWPVLSLACCYGYHAWSHD